MGNCRGNYWQYSPARRGCMMVFVYHTRRVVRADDDDTDVRGVQGNEFFEVA